MLEIPEYADSFVNNLPSKPDHDTGRFYGRPPRWVREAYNLVRVRVITVCAKAVIIGANPTWSTFMSTPNHFPDMPRLSDRPWRR